jgi:hypothetical protein
MVVSRVLLMQICGGMVSRTVLPAALKGLVMLTLVATPQEYRCCCSSDQGSPVLPNTAARMWQNQCPGTHNGTVVCCTATV